MFLATLSRNSDDRAALEAAPPAERAPRHPLQFCELRLEFGGQMHLIRMRDIASGGLCGITDAPVRRLDIVSVELELGTWIEAQIRWVRRSSIGLAFTEPLCPDLLGRICNRYRPRLARH